MGKLGSSKCPYCGKFYYNVALHKRKCPSRPGPKRR